MLKLQTLHQSFEPGCRLNYNVTTGSFRTVREKRVHCCRIKKRAKGESAKQTAALKQAILQLNISLKEESPLLDNQQLFQVYKKLKPRLSRIHSHTRGVFGWFSSLFRSKKETKALKELGKEIQKLQKILICSDKVSLQILEKINRPIRTNHHARINSNLFKKLERELPHLIRTTPPTNKDFGITAANPFPITPFFLKKERRNFFLYLPANSLTPHTAAPQRHAIRHIREVKTHYQNYIMRQKELIASSCNHLGSEEIAINHVRHDAQKVRLTTKINEESKAVVLEAEVFNPLTAKVETFELIIKARMTKQVVESWVLNLIAESKNRLEKVESFVKRTFSNDLESESLDDGKGITLKWSGEYVLDYVKHGVRVTETAQGLQESSYRYLETFREQADKNLDYWKDFHKSSDAQINFLGNRKLTIIASSTYQLFKIEFFNPYLDRRIPFNASLEEAVQSAKKIIFFKHDKEIVSITPEAFISSSPLNGSEKIEIASGISIEKLSMLVTRTFFSDDILSKANNGRAITWGSITSNITHILRIIDEHKTGLNRFYIGIPIDKTERDNYFKDLEARLSHIVKALEKPENAYMIPRVLVNLAVAGGHCGVRLKDEVNTSYNMLCTPEVNESNVDLDQWLQYLFDRRKKEVVTQMVSSQPFVDAHVISRYLKQLKSDKITIPGWNVTDFTDFWEHNGGGLFGSAITVGFKSRFEWASQLDFIQNELNQRLSDYTKPTICQHFGVQVINRLKAAVKEWLLPFDLDKKAAYDSAETDYQRDLILGSIIDHYKMVLKDPNTCTIRGVAYEGVLLLALQSGLIKLSPFRRAIDLLEKLKTL